MKRTEETEGIVEHQGKHYSFVKTVLEIKSLPDFLVLSVERIDPLQQTFIDSEVDIFYELKDKKNQCLDLFGVICFHGDAYDGHYTAYHRSPPEKKWTLFNDLDEKLRKVSDPPLATNGVLFFYTNPHI